MTGLGLTRKLMIIVTNIRTAMRYFIYLTLILSSVVNAGEIHKWVDQDGNIHYGDSPPVSSSSNKVKVDGKPSNPGRSLPRLGENSANEDAGNTTDSEDEESANAPEVPEDQAKIACENAQKDLKVIKRSNRIKLKSADGTTRYLTTEEIADRRKKSEEAIEQFCN